MPGLDIHCGLWRALAEAGIEADAHAGTSAGAIAAAYAAMGERPHAFEHLLRSLRDGDVRRDRWLWRLRLPWIDSILCHEPIEQLLEQVLPEAFEDLEARLSVFATVEPNGFAVDFDAGPILRQAVLASMSISGFWPAVRMRAGHGDEQRELPMVDGGTSANLPVPPDYLAYDEVYLLVATGRLSYAPGNALGRMRRNVDLLMQDQVLDTIARVEREHPRVTVLWPRLDTPRGALHFDHGLIDETYTWARDQLQRAAG